MKTIPDDLGWRRRDQIGSECLEKSKESFVDRFLEKSYCSVFQSSKYCHVLWSIHQEMSSWKKWTRSTLGKTRKREIGGERERDCFSWWWNIVELVRSLIWSNQRKEIHWRKNGFPSFAKRFSMDWIIFIWTRSFIETSKDKYDRFAIFSSLRLFSRTFFSLRMPKWNWWTSVCLHNWIERSDDATLSLAHPIGSIEREGKEIRDELRLLRRMAPEVIACDENPQATYDNRVRTSTKKRRRGEQRCACL